MWLKWDSRKPYSVKPRRLAYPIDRAHPELPTVQGGTLICLLHCIARNAHAQPMIRYQARRDSMRRAFLMVRQFMVVPVKLAMIAWMKR